MVYVKETLNPELVMGRVHPLVGLGWVGSKSMGRLTQSCLLYTSDAADE